MMENLPNVTEAVKADLDERTERGLATYGCSLAEAKLTLRESLQHANEEILDQAQYLKTAILTIDAQEDAPVWIGADFASGPDQGCEVVAPVEVPFNLEVEIIRFGKDTNYDVLLFQDIDDAFDQIRNEIPSGNPRIVIQKVEQE